MINEATVLILGAGASAPYEFPTGTELVDRIIALFDPANSDNEARIEMTIAAYLASMEQKANATARESKLQGAWAPVPSGKDALTSLEKFRLEVDAYNPESIDEFLARTSDHKEIGHHAVAAIFLEAEKDALDNGAFDRTGKSDWYSDLGRMLSVSIKDFQLNDLSIVTFNYDRSLEYMLHRKLSSITADGGTPEKWALEIRSGIEVLHPHGSLGGIHPFQKDPKECIVGFGELSISNIAYAAARIGIMDPELIRNQDFPIEDNGRVLSRAQHVYMMGLGFHPCILSKLPLHLAKNRQVVCACGTTDNRVYRDNAQRRVAQMDSRFGEVNFEIRPMTCKELFLADPVLQRFRIRYHVLPRGAV